MWIGQQEILARVAIALVGVTNRVNLEGFYGLHSLTSFPVESDPVLQIRNGKVWVDLPWLIAVLPTLHCGTDDRLSGRLRA